MNKLYFTRERERDTYTETDRQTDRHGDTEIQRDRERDRDRQTDRQRQRQRRRDCVVVTDPHSGKSNWVGFSAMSVKYPPFCR